MIKAGSVAVIVSSVCVLWPALAHAQSNPPLKDLGSNVFQNILVARTPSGGGVIAHTPVFLGDPTVTSVTGLIDGIHAQVGGQLALFPAGSSSAAFTYSYDPTLGTFSRTTGTFGPAFAERAETIGRGKFSFGVNYLHASYNSLDGKDLTNGDVKFDLLHQPLTPPSYVEGDVIEAAMAMKISTNTTVLYGSFGLTNRLDIGIAVPIVRVSMDITYHATIRDFSTHTVSPLTHVFANGAKTNDYSGSGSAAGVGDVLLRAKYGLLTTGPMHLSADVDVRVPSGDADNMLGSGATLTEISLVGSGAINPRLSPHVNFGYTVAKGSSTVTDQVNYIGGIEFAASPKLTILGDLVGRTLRDSVRLGDASIVHPFRQGDTAPLESVTLQTVQLTPSNLSSVWGAAGLKFTPGSNVLVSANLLFALNNAGLRSRVTPVVGVEFAF